MKNNKITTIIVILATLALAGIAVYTAIRLYQLRSKPVAPNVPESAPQAVGTGAPIELACQLKFNIAIPTSSPSPTPIPTKSPSPTPTPVPGYPSCISKKVYFASNTTNNQDFTRGQEITSNSIVRRGDTLIFAISINEADGGLNYVTSDVLNSKLTYISYKSTDYCSFSSSTQTLSCNGTDSGRTGIKVEIKVKVDADATVGEIVNTATIKASTNTATCNVAFNVVTPSPSPTPGPTHSPSPSPTPLITGTPSPTPSPVAQCNTSCTSSSQCPANLTCYIASGTTGFCRNASCTGESDCLCPAVPTPTGTTYIAQGPTATPAPQPTLPESGTDWPTVAGAFFGFLVIVGSLLLAF